MPWQQQHHQQQQPQSAHATGPPSPTSMSSGCSSPGYSPSRTLDLSGSSSSFSDRKAAAACYNYKGGPVHEWTKEQVSREAESSLMNTSKHVLPFSGWPLVDGHRAGALYTRLQGAQCGGRRFAHTRLEGLQNAGRLWR